MSPKQREIFEQKILAPVVEGHRRREEPLSGFMALEGSEYKMSRQLMVVGRAVNGWGEGVVPSALQDANAIDSFIKNIFFANGECQMAWVVNGAGNQGGYNTNRSQFWAATKSVAQGLGVFEAGQDQTWSSRIVWSNLYKLSPAAGGNPSNALCEIQEAGCIELLRQEIAEYAPQVVLFLTGMTWAWPFMKGLGTKLYAMDGLVEARGWVDARESGPPTAFVVAEHPQGNKREPLVNDILAAIASLDRES